VKSLQQLALVVLVLLTSRAVAFAADMVIVESTAPDLHAGQVIASGKTLNIPAGAKVAIVGEDGKVIKLSGPFSGIAAPATAASSEKGTVQALSRLFADKGPAADSWGTFRGAEIAGDGDTPPDVWSIDVRRSETACVPAGTQPVLWRADASQPMSGILLLETTGREGPIDLGAGQQTLAWPQTPEIVDGGAYAIRDADGSGERRLFLRVIPAGTPNGIQQVAWMSDAGCLRQAKALLTQIAAAG
jgi:hypothetical protein